MGGSEQQRQIAVLLERYPRTFADDLGIPPLDRPSALFRLLVMALLMSARIRASVALDAARALTEAGWTTAAKMADASWADRAATLNQAGYARFDERTSTMLGETSQHLIDRWRGDLRALRAEAGRDPTAERHLLLSCKGIGSTGADIFFRDVQRSWVECRPFVDGRALRAARRLDLAGSVDELAELVGEERLVPVVGALVRADLDGALDDVRAATS